MLRAKVLLASIIAVFPAVLSAAIQPPVPPDHGWCGTGPAATQEQRELHQWLLEKARTEGRIRANDSTGGVRVQNGIYIVTADSSTVAFDHPFDLARWSLRFTRKDSQTFEFSRVPAEWDINVGSLLGAFDFSSQSTAPLAYELKRFQFPFGNAQLSRLYFTSSNAIVTAPSNFPSLLQQHALETVAPQRPMISPFFQPLRVGLTKVFVNESATSLLVTWRASNSLHTYGVQARLDASGNIEFSYTDLVNATWGTVVVTSGEEPFYSGSTTLASATDSSGDVDPAIRQPWRDIVDLTSVEVRRLADSDLLEFRLQVKGPIDRSKFAASDQFYYAVHFANSRCELRFLVGKTYDGFAAPCSPFLVGSGAARVEGDSVILRVLQSLIPSGAGTRMVSVSSYDSTQADFINQAIFADTVSFSLTLDPPRVAAESDLSEVPPSTSFRRPIFESFTLPVVDLAGVWNRLKSAYEFTDEQTDVVPVYQTFSTHITIANIAAFSTVGNPAVDGIARSNFSPDPELESAQYGTKFPVTTTLLHMNQIGYGNNTDTYWSGQTLAHEFGHRWLYHIGIMENGAITEILNPDGGHPFQYVHMPAAFRVDADHESSVMGGGHFTDLGGGRFTTGAPMTMSGYSWNELYLMGLASPSEVTPWFYVANPPAELNNPYWPPSNSSVTGTRKDVVVQQIIDALGPRVPTYNGSSRIFRVLYVLVERPDAQATDGDFQSLATYTSAFERRFPAATGGRGSIMQAQVALHADFTYSPSSIAPGQEISFSDASTGGATSWSWSFGDGETSTLQNPKHTYRAAGSYSVMLRVASATADSTITRNIIIGTPIRKRTTRP